MSFQDALYTLEVGWGRRLVEWVAILVGFIFLSLLYLTLLFRGLDNPTAMDQAQLARELAAGHGFRTQLVRPSALKVFYDYYSTPRMAAKNPPPKIDVFALPDITNAPVYPVVLSLLFRVSGVNLNPEVKDLAKQQIYAPERVIVIFAQLSVLLTAILLYLWAMRMFDSRVAFVSTAAFVGCDLIWQFSLSGLATNWLVMLMTALGLALHEALMAQEEDRPLAVWGWTVASALLLTLMVLTKLSLAWLIFPYAALLLATQWRFTIAPLVALLVVVGAITPWFVRNYQVCGNPFGTAFYKVAEYGTAKEAIGDRTYFQKDGWPVKRALHKIYEGYGNAMGNFFSLTGSSAVIILALAALMHRFKRHRVQSIRWFLLGSAAVLVFASALMRPDPKAVDEENLLILIFPGLAAIGAAFFYVLLERLDLGLQIVRYIVVTFFLIICTVPLVVALLPPGPGLYRYPPYFPPMIRVISQMLTPQELLVSDIAAGTAWYGDRVSLWMPTTLKEFYQINDTVQWASGMLLTPESSDTSLYQIDKGPSQDWAPILRRQGLPQGFPLSVYTPIQQVNNDYIFFSDRRRWESRSNY